MGIHDIEDVVLAERAAEWLHRLPNASLQQQAEFFRWLKQSPRHVREMLLAMSWDELLRSIDPKRSIDIVGLGKVSDANVIRLQPLLSRSRHVVPQPSTPKWRRYRPLLAVAAGVIAAIPLAFLAKTLRPDRVLSTGSGEWQTQSLQDGSIVRLGPLTRLVIDFSDRQRRVRLATGDAIFAVARERQRPFVVETEQAAARAAGTTFGVTGTADSTVVTVSEGKVAVYGPKLANIHGENGAVVISEGEQVVIGAARLLARRRVSLKNELPWGAGQLVYAGIPAKLADEFNRRNESQIRLSDPKLQSAQVYGHFKLSDPAAFARFVEEQPRH